jgi:hypothetical protein
MKSNSSPTQKKKLKRERKEKDCCSGGQQEFSLNSTPKEKKWEIYRSRMREIIDHLCLTIDPIEKEGKHSSIFRTQISFTIWVKLFTEVCLLSSPRDL